MLKVCRTPGPTAGAKDIEFRTVCLKSCMQYMQGERERSYTAWVSEDIYKAGIIRPFSKDDKHSFKGVLCDRQVVA